MRAYWSRERSVLLCKIVKGEREDLVWYELGTEVVVVVERGRCDEREGGGRDRRGREDRGRVGEDIGNEKEFLNSLLQSISRLIFVVSVSEESNTESRRPMFIESRLCSTSLGTTVFSSGNNSGEDGVGEGEEWVGDGEDGVGEGEEGVGEGEDGVGEGEDGVGEGEEWVGEDRDDKGDWGGEGRRVWRGWRVGRAVETDEEVDDDEHMRLSWSDTRSFSMTGSWFLSKSRSRVSLDGWESSSVLENVTDSSIFNFDNMFLSYVTQTLSVLTDRWTSSSSDKVRSDLEASSLWPSAYIGIKK